MRIYRGVFVLFTLFLIFLTAGCTVSDNSYAKNSSVSSSDNLTTPQNYNTSTEITPSATDISSQNSGSEKTTTSVKPAYTPNFHAGMIVSDEEENLKLVTVYKKISGKYGTRSLLKGSDGEAYLIKDASFKELGSSYDEFRSINNKYPILYDDLNYNSDTYSYYNYQNKDGNRIYIYTDDDNDPKLIGYLRPESIETMEFVNTRN